MVKYAFSEIMPVRIVKCSDSVSGENNLLKPKDQIAFDEQEKLIFNGAGSFVIDFGAEYFGVLRLLTGNVHPENHVAKIRITLGESLAECCAKKGYKNNYNFHGVKDMDFDTFMFSEIQTGYSGFRFAKIELISNVKFEIINCKIIARQDNLKRVGYFECNDERVNKIFDTAARTVELCQQNGYIWDGIKRDRIVWVGDLHPESLSIMLLSGDYERVYKSLTFVQKYTPLPGWINGIPSYSMWYIIILYDLYVRTARRNYLKENLDYIKGVLHQFDVSLSENGDVDFTKVAYDQDMRYFLDWATFEKDDAETGTKSLLIWAIHSAQKILRLLGEDFGICDKIRAKVIGWEKEVSYKQVKAIQCLAKENVTPEDVDLMKKNGVSGVSTFMSYYIFKSLAEGGANRVAFEGMKEYYGAMLDLGATTFWEDFDIDWLKDNPLPLTSDEETGRKHIHADFGQYCYKNFRHSLCHGWSSGVIPYLYEKVVGIEIVEPGYKKIKVTPDLCGLKEVKARICTPYGPVDIYIKDENGKVETKINVPDGVEIVK